METPETSKAWDDASKSQDGNYYSTARGQDMAAAMLNHSRKMERERDEARKDLRITQEAWVKAKAERADALRERDDARKKFWHALNKYGHAQQDALDARAQRDALVELLRCIDETLETLESGVPDQEAVAIAMMRGEIARGVPAKSA